MRYQPADRSVLSVFRHLQPATERPASPWGRPESFWIEVLAGPSSASKTTITHGERLDGHVEEGCTNHALIEFTCSCQTSAELRGVVCDASFTIGAAVGLDYASGPGSATGSALLSITFAASPARSASSACYPSWQQTLPDW